MSTQTAQTAYDQVPTAPMDRQECLARLALEPLGRVIVPRDQLPPAVVPAVYLVAGQTLLVHTAHPLPASRERPRRIVFAVDRIAADRRRGWSVLVEGVVADEPGDDRVGETPENGDHWLTLSVDVVRGRRIGDDVPPSPEPGW